MSTNPPHPDGEKPPTPAKPASPPKPGVNPRRFETRTSLRTKVLAIGTAVVVLGLILWGISTMNLEKSKPSRNMVTGTITAKIAKGEKEREISVGRKGLRERETDSGYAFMVKHPQTGKEYEVPTNPAMYEAKKVGDPMSFILPPSEQR